MAEELEITIDWVNQVLPNDQNNGEDFVLFVGSNCDKRLLNLSNSKFTVRVLSDKEKTKKPKRPVSKEIRMNKLVLLKESKIRKFKWQKN